MDDVGDLAAACLEIRHVNEIRTILEDTHRFCKICLETDGDLIGNNCLCKGTMGYVHESCLVRWIRFSHRRICPDCKSEYTMEHIVNIQPYDGEQPPRRIIDTNYVFTLFIYTFVYSINVTWVILIQDITDNNTDLTTYDQFGTIIVALNCGATGAGTLIRTLSCAREDIPVLISVFLCITFLFLDGASVIFVSLIMIIVTCCRTLPDFIQKLYQCRQDTQYTTLNDESR